jgi:H+/Cl- antiporter ClcA
MAPVFFVLALATVRLFAPNAKGSGIPQVMAAIELSSSKFDGQVGRLLSLRIVLTKIVSSLFMVLGGGAIGREGPTIQVAGSIFRTVNKRITVSWPKLSTQSFILTGAAAGLAAAFNTPLGGVVFAMEELAKVHVRFFRTALFSAVIIAGLTAQGLLGPYLYLGYPDVKGTGISILPAVIITALISGVLGSLMCKLILKLMKWKRSFSAFRSFAFVICAALIVSGIAFFLNSEILGSGKDLMNRSLFTEQKDVSWLTVLMRLVGPVISFNTGAAGGVFAPALAAGSSVGSFVSDIFNYHGAAANIIILSGMVGLLTGVTRTPFTSAILVLEMTDRHSVIFQLMIAALISNIVSLLIDKQSFYERLKKDYVIEAKAEETRQSK